jgi:hypothetical protein
MATSRPSKFPRVPYSQIRFIVGKCRVSQDYEVVADEVERLMRKAHLNRKPEMKPVTASEIREARRYARQVHFDNRQLYNRVMRGF